MVFFEKHGVEESGFFRVFPLKNYNFPLHFHRAYEMIFVNEGKLSVTIQQKVSLLNKNDLVFIFTNQMHEFKTCEYSEITIILFSPDLIGDFYMNYKGFIPEDNVLHFQEGLMLDEWSSVYHQKSFLYGICAELIGQKAFLPVKRSPQTKVLNQILLYVEQNYSTDCTLKDIAKHLQYDYPYLSKLFSRRMNMTFTEYLNNYRISQACYLLKNYHMSVSEVANSCGYNNLRSFHRNFKKMNAVSPGEYREFH